MIVLWFLALVMRSFRSFDKPTGLATVYCGLVFGGGRISEVPELETYITTAISFVLGLMFFWVLHKVRRENLRWFFVFVLGPVTIEAMWALPDVLSTM